MAFSPKQLSRIVRPIFIVLVLLTALCAGLHTVADHDMGLHLAIGRYLVQNHRIPYNDILTFTSAGKPWVYPPFSGAIFYLAYAAFGYAGLSWFCALTCMVITAYLVRRGDIGSAALAMLAVPPIAERTGLRADLFSTACFAFLLGELWSYQRGRRSRLWLLPLLMFLWVNLHPGFIAGLAAIAAYLMVEMMDLLFAERRGAVLLRLRRIWPWLLGCVAATLVNPWGTEIYTASFTLTGILAPDAEKLNSASFLADYQAIPISTHLLNRLIDIRHIDSSLTWLLLVAVILVGLFLWKKQMGAAALTAIALCAVLSRVRYEALFAITIATLGGTLLSELFAERPDKENKKIQEQKTTPPLISVPGSAGLFVTLVLCGVAMLHIADYVSGHTYVVFRPYFSFGAGLSSSLPTGAVAFIQREHLPGNIFEDFELGSYAAWALGPEYPAFIDTRGGPLNPELIVEQNRLYHASPDSQPWQDEASRWNLNVLLVSTYLYRGLPMDPLAFCQSSTWRPVYMDDVSMVFLRNTPQNAPWIHRLQIDCLSTQLTPPASGSRSALHDYYLHSGAVNFELNRNKEAEDSLRRASALYSDDPYAHVVLGGLFQREGRYSDAEQEYRASIAINESDAALSALGKLYASEGRYADAVQAFERAANLSVNSFETYMSLGKLQILLNHPEEALAAYKKAEKNSPFRDGGESLAPEAYALMAEGRSEAHRLLGQRTESIAFQKEATRITPKAVARWKRLEYLYAEAGQQQLAAETRAYINSLESPTPELSQP